MKYVQSVVGTNLGKLSISDIIVYEEGRVKIGNVISRLL